MPYFPCSEMISFVFLDDNKQSQQFCGVDLCWHQDDTWQLSNLSILNKPTLWKLVLYFWTTTKKLAICGLDKAYWRLMLT